MYDMILELTIIVIGLNWIGRKNDVILANTLSLLLLANEFEVRVSNSGSVCCIELHESSKLHENKL